MPPAARPTRRLSANAERLIASVRQRYPEARLAMVGTLARGAADGGGRRTEVDALLGAWRPGTRFRSSASATG